MAVTFTRLGCWAGLGWAGLGWGWSGGAGHVFLDGGLDLGGTLHVGHVAGAVDQVAGCPLAPLGLGPRTPRVGAAPDHGDRDPAAGRRERGGGVAALGVAVQQRAQQ